VSDGVGIPSIERHQLAERVAGLLAHDFYVGAMMAGIITRVLVLRSERGLPCSKDAAGIC
jgi:hypothetical protein